MSRVSDVYYKAHERLICLEKWPAQLQYINTVKQPNFTLASGSGIVAGASSSQSSGFSASGSGIFSRSSQVSGFLSLGSSISAGGLTGGETSESKLPVEILLLSRDISNVLSGCITRRRRWGFLSSKIFSNFSLGVFACFSSNAPVIGFLCRKMKWS